MALGKGVFQERRLSGTWVLSPKGMIFQSFFMKFLLFFKAEITQVLVYSAPSCN